MWYVQVDVPHFFYFPHYLYVRNKQINTYISKMGKYLKEFATYAEYQTYINGNTFVLPNVSLCDVENEMHYNPTNEVVAKFNVTSTSNATRIKNNMASGINKIIIDG